MNIKHTVTQWGNGGVVTKRGKKTICYTVSGNSFANLQFNKMEVTERLFDGPDCYRWRKTFAFWPVKTIKGKYVWLRPIYKQRFWAVWGKGFHMEPEVEYAEILDILTEM